MNHKNSILCLATLSLSLVSVAHAHKELHVPSFVQNFVQRTRYTNHTTSTQSFRDLYHNAQQKIKALCAPRTVHRFTLSTPTQAQKTIRIHTPAQKIVYGLPITAIGLGSCTSSAVLAHSSFTCAHIARSADARILGLSRNFAHASVLSAVGSLACGILGKKLISKGSRMISQAFKHHPAKTNPDNL